MYFKFDSNAIIKEQTFPWNETNWCSESSSIVLFSLISDAARLANSASLVICSMIWMRATAARRNPFLRATTMMVDCTSFTATRQSCNVNKISRLRSVDVVWRAWMSVMKQIITDELLFSQTLPVEISTSRQGRMRSSSLDSSKAKRMFGLLPHGFFSSDNEGSWQIKYEIGDSDCLIW